MTTFEALCSLKHLCMCTSSCVLHLFSKLKTKKKLKQMKKPLYVGIIFGIYILQEVLGVKQSDLTLPFAGTMTAGAISRTFTFLESEQRTASDPTNSNFPVCEWRGNCELARWSGRGRFTTLCSNGQDVHIHLSETNANTQNTDNTHQNDTTQNDGDMLDPNDGGTSWSAG